MSANRVGRAEAPNREDSRKPDKHDCVRAYLGLFARGNKPNAGLRAYPESLNAPDGGRGGVEGWKKPYG